MVKKTVFLFLICCGFFFDIHAVERYTFALTTELNLIGVGLGMTCSFTDQLQSQAIVGVSSNFIENKWDDPFIQLKSQYQVLKGNKFALPLGISLGGRIMHNFKDSFGVFYIGAFTGLDFQLNRRNRISLNIGYKYGKKHYEVTRSSSFGKTSFIETYTENPFLASLSYTIMVF